MNDFQNSLKSAAGGMQRQALRLRLTSENMANADTPGFRRKLAEFDPIIASGESGKTRQNVRIQLDKSGLTEIYDPSHPLANEKGSYFGSNVNLLIEIADAREAQRSYEANMKMFEQTRKMTSSLMNLLKR